MNKKLLKYSVTYPQTQDSALGVKLPKKGVRIGPIKIGGEEEGGEGKKPSPIELQSKLSYTTKRLEKKADAAMDKYEKKRLAAKQSLRDGNEKVARMRLKSAQLQSVLANRARNSAMGIEAVKDRLEQVQDYKELQGIINELGDSLGDLMPEKMMGSVKESMAELEKVMSSATIMGEKMSEELSTITTGEVSDQEVNEQMERLAEEVQAEAAEELKPVEIEERAEAARTGAEKESESE